MEKTMQYALNEALETGRRSAMPVFLERELREKIAQQIESITIEPSIDNAIGMQIRAAGIARTGL